MARRLSGFTMIELLVVLLVVLGLMGVAFPIYSQVISRMAVRRTQGLVHAIAAAIATYPTTTITLPGAGQRRLWDVDADGQVDGDPALTFADPLRGQCAAVGYRGLLAMTGLALERRQVEVGTGRILDGWKRPVRIRFANASQDPSLGPAGVGVWSFGARGPSATDPSQPADERDVIASWK